ncbi:glycerol kinase-like [Daktulosphaira vitifoliae]|uniref:glycerol kinase-like n=1 Tax=Daktulosphaira vitifoliae TaxID=58002 RepID=UPI0021A9780B|nr:glycerol kinase-like [Daktulosphaira vitifoliae]
MSDFENVEDETLTDIQNKSIEMEHDNPIFIESIENVVLNKKYYMIKKPQSELIGALSVESELISFTVFSTNTGREVALSSKRLLLITDQEWTTSQDKTFENYPNITKHADQLMTKKLLPGWVEQDPCQIWTAINEVVSNVAHEMCRSGLPATYIKSLGITNETSTVLAWNIDTGQTLSNAIHWTDSRAVDGPIGVFEWLLNHSELVKCAKDKCRFGTLDTWILWKLTAGEVYVTELTNASQTGLLALPELEWNKFTCQARGIPLVSLPVIRKPAHNTLYAVVAVGDLQGLSIYSVMGRPNASMYGYSCDSVGQVSVTLDERIITVMTVIGECPVTFLSGLCPVVAYILPNSTNKTSVLYALRISFKSNEAIAWIKGNLGLVKSTAECMNAYNTASPSLPLYMSMGGDIYCAPYKTLNSGGILCGITSNTTKENIVCAAVDSMCFGVSDVLKMFLKEVDESLHTLFVDGAYSNYSSILQRMADIYGNRVIKNHRKDMAIYGIAIAAGQAININLISNSCDPDVYDPKSSIEQRSEWTKQWNKCVLRSYGWNRINDKLCDQFLE